MAYDKRENGTHAMTCDTPGCHIELISPGEQELHEDMALAGWQPIGKDDAGNVLFRCSECARGQHPAAALVKQMLGGDEVMMQAPCTVSKGDAAYDDNGEVFGHYRHDANQGDPVKIKVKMPQVETPPSAVELFDEMLEGTDADDDAIGRVSAVAPRMTSPPSHDEDEFDLPNDPIVTRSGEDLIETVEKASADGTEFPMDPEETAIEAATPPAFADARDHTEAFVEAERPDPEDPRVRKAIAKAPTKPKGPSINVDAMVDTDDLFNSFTSWDPDA